VTAELAAVIALIWAASLMAVFVAGAVWEGSRSGGTLDQHLARALRDDPAQEGGQR
jgi:hypothetical protein